MSETQIHDLGHTAYVGPRTPASRRFLAIARNVFSVAWTSRWGVKVPFLLAAGTTFAAAVVMYILRMKLAEEVRTRGVPIPQAEAIVFMSLRFYQVAAFILAIKVVAAAVADDLRMGAFLFYFARPLRPGSYVAGKLLGLSLVIGVPMFAGPVILALVRVLLADDAAQMVTLLPVLGKGVLLGVMGTAAFVLPAAGLGALVAKRQTAQALYAVYAILIGVAVLGMSRWLHLPELRAISLTNDVAVLGRAIFGLPQEFGDPSGTVAGIALLVLCAAGLAVIVWRVRGAETATLGS